MKRLSTIILSILSVFIIIFLVGKFLKAESKTNNDYKINDELVKQEIQKPVVKVKNSFRGKLKEKIFASGRLRSFKEIKLYPKRGGQVKKIFVENGQNVIKGDKILLLDDREINLKIKEQKTKLLQAKSDLILRINDSKDLQLFDKKEKELLASLLKKLKNGLSSNELLKELDEEDYKIALLKERTGYNKELINLNSG
jgi:multidrug efflux pump subunit AcrA (membrane-fusion protein)